VGALKKPSCNLEGFFVLVTFGSCMIVLSAFFLLGVANISLEKGWGYKEGLIRC
jgi:hypothetical protein